MFALLCFEDRDLRLRVSLFPTYSAGGGECYLPFHGIVLGPLTSAFEHTPPCLSTRSVQVRLPPSMSQRKWRDLRLLEGPQ